ncbi:MAG: trigger factor [Thermodesulfobacteriota bacterium]
MQVNVEDLSALTKRMSITLPQDYVAKALEAAYDKLKHEVNLKGFRKGKVPRQVLEKNYGPKVEYDVADRMIQDTYFDALEKVNLDAVAHPEIRDYKYEADGSFAYQAEVDVRPQFELGEYRGLEVEQPEVAVSDAEVDQELEALRRQMAPLKSVEDRGIAEGDIAIIDFAGFHDGAAMKEVRGENYSVDVGSGRNGKEFEEKLVGLRKGEEAVQEVEFPAGFSNPVLAGKKVEFRITVKDVKERVLPALDDDFAKEVGEEFKGLDDLRQQIRERRTKKKEEAQRGDLTDRLMANLLEKHPFEVPPRLVAYEIEGLIKELENNLDRQGMTLESAGLTKEKLVEQYREAAEKRVRGDFLLKKIAEKEGIKLENEDIEKGFQRIADQYNMPMDEVKKFFQSRNELLPFMSELLSEKILSFLVEHASVKRVAATA